MSVTIIFGGQFGSEGKGKVAHDFTILENAKYCVRVGGTNSGHTVYKQNKKYIFRQLPTGIIEDGRYAVLPAGSYIDEEVLFSEIAMINLSNDRLLIDENAVVITHKNKLTEQADNLRNKIGSTMSGTGAAVIDRILRNDDELLAKNCKSLKPYLTDTKQLLRTACDKNENIIIEGTQGFGLSNIHSKYYPYVTSRDTSAAAFLSETGLSPFDVKNIVMVIRSFPIRVAGNSGPLKNEINWEILKKELDCDEDLTEYTSCTNLIRRVGRFDAEIVKESILCNKPNVIVLNHIDYIEPSKQKHFIELIEQLIKQKINYFGDNQISIKEL